MKIFILTLAPLIWGAGFAATRFTFESYSPLWSHGIRYIIAGLLSLPFLIIYKDKLNHKTSFNASILLSCGLILQTIGIKYTSLAKSGFFTSFYVIFTPIFMSCFYKSKFKKDFWACVLLTLIGVSFMGELKIDGLNYGDLMILLSSLFFSFHILYIDKVSKDEKHPIIFNLYQCFFAGLIGSLIAFLSEGFPTYSPLIPGSSDFSIHVTLSFVTLSLFSSIIAFSIQVIVQKNIQAHIVSLIFLLESIFAALFGWFFFQEIMSPHEILGSALIILPIAYISFTPAIKNKQQASS